MTHVQHACVDTEPVGTAQAQLSRGETQVVRMETEGSLLWEALMSRHTRAATHTCMWTHAHAARAEAEGVDGGLMQPAQPSPALHVGGKFGLGWAGGERRTGSE